MSRVKCNTKLRDIVRLVMRQEFKGNLTQAAIHQLYEKQEARRKKKRNSRRKEVDQHNQNAPRQKPVSIVE